MRTKRRTLEEAEWRNSIRKAPQQRNMGRGSFSKTGVCNAKGSGGTKAWKQDQSVCLDNRNRNVRMEEDQRETGDKEESLE